VLLDLDGQVLVVDPKGYRVQFRDAGAGVAGKTPRHRLFAHPARPHGARLVGFDNAHPVGRQKRGQAQDHRHRLQTTVPYEYRDAATLLADFWEMVDAVLREKGVTS